MGNPRRNPTLLHLLSILLLQFSLISPSCGARFVPVDNHLISCGSASPSTTVDHRVFLPDDHLCSSHSTWAVFPAEPILPAVSPLYQSARISKSAFSYRFPIKAKGTHLLRLYFYPFVTTSGYNLSAARFHVSAAGYALLTDFGTSTLLVKEYFLRFETDELAISFAPACSSPFAFVNAIEVVTVPGDIIPDIARLVKPGRIEKSDGLSKQAFETLYRVNVGGPKITPFNDTLWRNWVPDSIFLNSTPASSRTLYFSGRIRYTNYGASREVAPVSVYNTARVMDGGDAADLHSNMTWAFDVSPGYKYLVRMHFCDIASLALNQIYFNVYINGNLVYEDFDLSEVSGQFLASPHYEDFVVDAGNAGFLSVSVGFSKLSSPSWMRAFVNGLEIMKMNNTSGSLDGEYPVGMAMGSAKSGFGEFLRSLLCGFAFMSLLGVVFMLVSKWRAEMRNSVAWSPLPMDVSEVKPLKGSTIVPGK